MKRNLAATISSISVLQGTCNALEKKFFVKLSSLEAVLDVDGNKATEATFDDFNGDIGELGKAKIAEGGSKSAWIKEVKTAVSITRS